MPANSDWVLYGPYNFDRTLIHEPFIFSLSNDIGRYAPRTIPIEVYANTGGGVVDANDYHGVYILMERIKQGGGRVDITDADPNATYDPNSSLFDQPDPAITGGYMWEIDRSEPSVPPFDAGGASIHWRSPVHPNDPGHAPKRTDDQQAYASAYLDEFWDVLRSPNAFDPVEGYAKYIEVDSWIDHHLLNVITMNVNAQRLSAFFHKDVGKKIEFGPIWDFDRAMDSADFRDDDPLAWRGQGGDLGTDFFGESGNGMGGLWWRQLFDDPNFFQQYIDRYHELRQAEFSDEAIDARIDHWANVVRESSERNINDVPSSFRQRPRTGGCHGTDPSEPSACNGTWQGEVENMRAWLHRRLEFMDDTFPIIPTVSLDGEVLPVLPEGISVSTGAVVTGFAPDAPDPVMIFDDTLLLSGEPGTVPITYFVPGDNTLGDTWAAVDFDDTAWELGTNGIGYQNELIDDYTDLITTTVKPSDVVAGAATIMTRTEFDVADLADIDDFVLQVKYDDAYVAYLNGTEVARKDTPPGLPTWFEGAGQRQNTSAIVFEDVDISAFKSLVVAGNNVLAIQIINSVADDVLDHGSADMLVLPQVVSRIVTVLPGEPGGTLYYTTDGSDPRGLDGLPSPMAAELGRDDSIVITANTQVIIRNLDGVDHGPESDLVTTDWSAPITHEFIVDPIGLPGDFNADGIVDADDIDVLFGAIRAGNMATEFDLNNSGKVDQADVEFLVENIIGTFMGDANLDGKVNAADLDQVGINWQRTNGAGWSDGDFTGNGAVNTQDLNVIGVNWRSGEPAAAVAHTRLPQAPLAAVYEAAVDPVDIAVRHIATDGRVAAQDAPRLSAGNTSVEYGFEANRWRHDVASSRRDSVRSDEASAQHEYNNEKLIDELFAKRK
jgi:hypothetical protein